MSKTMPRYEIPKLNTDPICEWYQRYTYSAPNNSNKTYNLCVWAESAILGGAKTALKLKYEI